jgi:hypothetical protein
MTTSNWARWLADRFSTDGTQSMSCLGLDVDTDTVLAAGVVARTGAVGGSWAARRTSPTPDRPLTDAKTPKTLTRQTDPH